MSTRQVAVAPSASLGAVVRKLLLHTIFLLIALGCLAGYEHFHVEGQSGPALACLIAAGVFGFLPVRDVIRILFGIEGKVLHLVHAVGGLALLALPLAGLVKSTPLLTHAAMAPFAIMGAAQAVMHQHQPRNAKQAAAMQRFAASLPEVAQFASAKDLTSPANAVRAVTVLSDIISKAQALGQTELEADPRFQSALSQVSARFGANLGLDAVDAVLNQLAANPVMAGAVPGLRNQVASARRTIAAGASK
ncbi:MAG TPA: hypothetical protein VH763_02360 [Gemmatimonadales bacterium]